MGEKTLVDLKLIIDMEGIEFQRIKDYITVTSHVYFP